MHRVAKTRRAGARRASAAGVPALADSLAGRVALSGAAWHTNRLSRLALTPRPRYLIECFTRVTGNKLTIYYTGSTWNPYTIVLLRSELTIGKAGARRRGVRHQGGRPSSNRPSP